MMIAEFSLSRLREAGLIIFGPLPPNHSAYPDGVKVAKPRRVAGHILPGYQATFGSDDVESDAPPIWLHGEGTRWFVTSHDFIPGPGQGDFVREFGSLDEATDDVLDFFFGDPSRMNAKDPSHRLEFD